jgi:cytochrome c5
MINTINTVNTVEKFKKDSKSFICYLFVVSMISFISPSLASAQNQDAEMPEKIHHTVPFITYPTPNYGTGGMSDLIKRGEYLAKVADCIGCHTDTKHNGAAFAGSLGIETPFGTLYSPNITPDKETGIGNWNDEEFITAMTKGYGPKGHYFPVFPFTSFTEVSRDDLLAIKAYLFSIPPVKNVPPENEMLWPFSVRMAQMGWKTLFFNKGEYKYDPEHTVEWNRGAYLVQGLGHCGECHTPRNIFGATKSKYFLSGAFVGGYYAPNITSYGLSDIPNEEIEDVFTKEQMVKKAGHVEGPMEEVDHNSLRYLSHEDLHAMVVYLRTVQSERPPVREVTGPISPEEAQDLYDETCSSCHSTGAAGAPVVGNQTTWAPRLKQDMKVIYTHAINGLNSMPPKGGCLSCADDEIKAVVDFMVNASKPGAAFVAGIVPQNEPVVLSMVAGKRIYDETCSVCHAQGKLGAPALGNNSDWMPRIRKNMDVLIKHTINGYNRMPPRGTCISCSNAEIIAAVKYMVQQSNPEGDYSLW